MCHPASIAVQNRPELSESVRLCPGYYGGGGGLGQKFQQVLALPEKDRRAVMRLVNSLVSAKAAARG